MRWLHTITMMTTLNTHSIHQWLQFIYLESQTTAIKNCVATKRRSESLSLNGLINSMCFSFTNDCTSLMNLLCHFLMLFFSENVTIEDFSLIKNQAECLIIIEVSENDIYGIKFPLSSRSKELCWFLMLISFNFAKNKIFISHKNFSQL